MWRKHISTFYTKHMKSQAETNQFHKWSFNQQKFKTNSEDTAEFMEQKATRKVYMRVKKKKKTEEREDETLHQAVPEVYQLSEPWGASFPYVSVSLPNSSSLFPQLKSFSGFLRQSLQLHWNVKCEEEVILI